MDPNTNEFTINDDYPYYTIRTHVRPTNHNLKFVEDQTRLILDINNIPKNIFLIVVYWPTQTETIKILEDAGFCHISIDRECSRFVKSSTSCSDFYNYSSFGTFYDNSYRIELSQVDIAKLFTPQSVTPMLIYANQATLPEENEQLNAKFKFTKILNTNASRKDFYYLMYLRENRTKKAIH